MSFLISLWVLVWAFRLTSAGCKYTNPQWMLNDDEFKSGPEVFFAQSDGTPDNDQIKLTAKWNLSFVEKYSQCVDTVEVMVKKIKDPKTKKAILCSLARSAIQNCTGSLPKKDYCSETLDVWVRVINKDYKDGVQPIGAPSMTRIGSLECEKRDSPDSLGDPMPSQSCESLQPSWKGSPDFIIPDGTKGKRFINVTWTNHLISSVACVDEIEIKYWVDGVPSTYHKESIKAAEAGDDDHPYHVELDVSVCKTYSYTLKAIKNDPYFVATNEGKFTSKCDDYLLNSLTTQTSKASKPTTTTSTSTTSTSSEEIVSEETTMEHEANDSTHPEAATASTDDDETKSAATEGGGGSTQPEDSENETTNEAMAEITNHADEEGKVNADLDNFDQSTNLSEDNSSVTSNTDEDEDSTHHENDLTEATSTAEHSTHDEGSTPTTEFEMLKNVSSEVDEHLDADNHNFTAESSRTSGEGVELSRSSNVNIGLTKHGRSLMGQTESSEKDNARALQLNPWGKSTSWIVRSHFEFSFVIPVFLMLQRFW